jgi:hypothetical protein
VVIELGERGFAQKATMVNFQAVARLPHERLRFQRRGIQFNWDGEDKMRMWVPCCLRSAALLITCNPVIRVPALTHLPHVTLLRDNRLAIKLKSNGGKARYRPSIRLQKPSSESLPGKIYIFP